MKTKLSLLILVLAVTLARAQTNDLTSLLQQGLLEEQANRNLDAAITDYKALATQFDKNRQIAATAIFRLGECYRMQGRTNEAAAQYQRILSDFSDQQTLATMSREDLTGMGMAANGTTGAESAAQQPAEAPVEIQLLAAQIAGIEKLKLDPEEQARAVLAIFPDDDLKAMLEILPELQEQLARFKANPQLTAQQFVRFVRAVGASKSSYGSSVEQFSEQTAKYQHNNGTNDVGRAEFQVELENFLIGQQVDFILGNQKARLAALQAAAGTEPAMNTPPDNAAPAATDEEDQEIQRIQTMIQNSPDLINATAPGDSGTPLAKAARNGWIKVANYLLAHGADVNADNSEALFSATTAGNRTMVELLLSHGADVNAAGPTHGGGTPLYIASENNFPAVVEVLLTNKADLNAKNNYGETPILAAIDGNHPEIVKLLLDAGADPDALSYAVYRGRLEIIPLLLARKADVNLKGQSGNTPLFRAVLNYDSESTKLLLAAGANANAENDQGRTALSYAAENGSPEIVKLLLAAQADPNGGKFDAPLLAAIEKKDVVSAELLLQAGANPNLKGNITWGNGEAASGWTTPLYSAVATGQFPMVQLLLKFKADPDGPVAPIRPLLFNALSDTNILEALLDAGAKPDVRDSTETMNGQLLHRTPLLEALANIQNLPDDSVEILLKHGANPNLSDVYGFNSLHWAANHLASTHVFLELLDHKADPNLRDSDGYTPLSILEVDMNSTSLNQESRVLAGQLADFLRQHGALEKLPDWDSITLGRLANNFSKKIFEKGTNDWNQFTLLEALVEFYGPSPMRPFGTQTGLFSQRLRRFVTNQASLESESVSFPDLAHITIVRPQPDSTNETRIQVNLLDHTNGIDCAKDVPLQFGDVVEIPEYNHPLASAPVGIPDAQLAIMESFLVGKVELITPDQKAELPFHFHAGGSLIGWLLSDTEAQKVLESSSDLSQVKVTRRDPATGKTRSWILDCSNLDNAPGLRVQDGDVIEVPQKSE